MGILHQIVSRKREEVERAQRRLPHAVLRKLAEATSPPISLKEALLRTPTPRILAEVKRASPSKGLMRPNEPVSAWDPVTLAQSYFEGGAAALSVLTDTHYFWGAPDLVAACKDATGLPVLRKDFIVSAYQVDESRWLGADAVLLIARCLEPSQVRDFAARAHDLRMDVLVEVHDQAELEVALQVERALIGINHRDLDRQVIDHERALRLRPGIPQERVVVAESGVSNPEQIERLVTAGINAFLVGEHLATSDDPAARLERLRTGIRDGN